MQVTNTGKVSYIRPIGTLLYVFAVLAIHALSLPLPYWAHILAILMVATWFVDRSLWKFIPMLKGYKNGE